jgi:hypothetical protein
MACPPLTANVNRRIPDGPAALARTHACGRLPVYPAVILLILSDTDDS